jgi:site-specific recombinase XerD
MLRVLGKGGHHREVYVTELVATALAAYLGERDRTSGTAAPTRRGRTPAGGSPLIATRTGGRCSRVDLYTLLRRIARHAGPALAGVADRVHPHALRHAYVTIALEQDARIHHVQADVGHASIATTQHYDRGLRTRSTTAADLVAAAIAAVPPGPDS